jgi:hypothetical protein
MADPNQPVPDQVDREIDARAVVYSVVGVFAVSALVLALMVGLFHVLESRQRRLDPPPSPLAEAGLRRLPPGPRLQAAPERQLQELRRTEEHLLDSYGWVDQASGVARIPIERAMDLILERGLGPGAQP